VFEAQDPAELVSHLERLEEGSHFLGEFGVPERFGWRSDAFELADPTWRKTLASRLNPSRVISLS